MLNDNEPGPRMCKRSIQDLGRFGGAPLFATPRPIGQLYTPPYEKFRDALRQIFDTRWLSNDGPMVRQLEAALAKEHGVKHCIAVANAGLALMMLLRIISKGRRGSVIMPAFSYRGLPHIAAWAGQVPCLCDVDLATHTLDPFAVSQAIDESTVAVLAVGTVYATGHRDELCAIAARHGIPIIFDSVNGFGATYHGKALGGHGLAEVFSLHATKLLNGFEGGYVTTDDHDLARLLRVQRTFFLGEDAELGHAYAYATGVNAKLNEVHAALALTCLDDVPSIVAQNKARHEAYRRGIGSIPGIGLVTYPDEKQEASNYLLNVVEIKEDWPLTRDEMVQLLRHEGMAVNAHLGPALHLSTSCSVPSIHGSLPVSEKLSRRYLQLPSGCLLGMNDIVEIAALFRFLHEKGGEISQRLAADPTIR